MGYETWSHAVTRSHRLRVFVIVHVTMGLHLKFLLILFALNQTRP